MAGSKKVEVTLRKSMIGSNERQRNTLRSLGLRKIGATRVHNLSPEIKGMVQKVAHLVEVKEI